MISRPSLLPTKPIKIRTAEWGDKRRPVKRGEEPPTDQFKYDIYRTK